MISQFHSEQKEGETMFKQSILFFFLLVALQLSLSLFYKQCQSKFWCLLAMSRFWRPAVHQWLHFYLPVHI